MSDREPFEQARAAGLRARHQIRLDRARQRQEQDVTDANESDLPAEVIEAVSLVIARGATRAWDTLSQESKDLLVGWAESIASAALTAARPALTEHATRVGYELGATVAVERITQAIREISGGAPYHDEAAAAFEVAARTAQHVGRALKAGTA